MEIFMIENELKEHEFENMPYENLNQKQQKAAINLMRSHAIMQDIIVSDADYVDYSDEDIEYFAKDALWTYKNGNFSFER